MYELRWFQAWEARLMAADRTNYRRYRFIRPLAPPTIERRTAADDATKAAGTLGLQKKTVARVRQIWPHDENEELNAGAT